jgi:hypothetical protein
MAIGQWGRFLMRRVAPSKTGLEVGCQNSRKAFRHRFLSTYKRDHMPGRLLPEDYKWIEGGNNTVRSGNCEFDAELYRQGQISRKDFNIHASIYGLHPGISTALGKQ